MPYWIPQHITSKEEIPREFNAVKVSLASPETIRSWTSGEVTRPETINYRTLRPERDGLFCEKIFGPVRDFECSCGKYKGRRYKGVVCDRCGVEVTHSKVRRERMGRIELAVPVAHIWFVRNTPSRIGALLNLTLPELEQIIYYESYIVIDPGNAPNLERNQMLSVSEYQALKEAKYEFVAEMGAPALKTLLASIDLEELARDLRAKYKIETSLQEKKKLQKRLNIVESFRLSGNRPEWMILEVIPVIPPDLRPLVPLEGGRFATSDLNDLYRRLINRNNRLKKLLEIKAPEVILRNEKRMLQEAVDALIDNTKRSLAVRGTSQRPLSSLSDSLKGKKGRFRQNLLGKRVDYSGRAVIVVGPELKIYQCGLPKSIALELFKPFVLRRLSEMGITQTIKTAKRFVEKEKPEIWDILEEITKDHPVLLNRAPTLHRVSIQAFYPVLIDGKAIQIHPLVCAPFNADFDGDQMAVHVPLTYEAQLEARHIMLSALNVLSPAHGKPLAIPSQDMVLGCYYLTKEKIGAKGEGMVFGHPKEVIIAHEQGCLDLHAKIKVRINGKLIETTCGRVIFNERVPQEVGFVNELVTKSSLENIIARSFELAGVERSVLFLDDLKELGFEYATRAAVSIGIDDLLVPPEKERIIEKTQKEVEQVLEQYRKGIITDGERYNKIIDLWTQAQNNITEVLFSTLLKHEQGFNPLAMMVDSKARGSKDQVRQLAGVRGLMSKPQKRLTGQEIIETPILSNFREGLTVLEYFISSHGGRKGLADTALKTSDAGYLTRRLVDVAQDVIVTEDDCGTIQGVERSALKDGEEVIIPLAERIAGRTAFQQIVDPITGEVIVKKGEIITESAAKLIEERGIESVKIRSLLTCRARHGVCAKCYGLDLATRTLVKKGEAVGIMAGQSIGEPGTQLTLRTFHIGGAATRITESSEVRSKYSGMVRFRNLKMVSSPENPAFGVVLSRTGEIIVIDKDKNPHRYKVPYGAIVRKKDKDTVEKDEVLYTWEPYTNPIITEESGKVALVDIVEGLSVREEVDPATMKKQIVVADYRSKPVNPRVVIMRDGKEVATYPLPTGALLLVKDGEEVKAGSPIAKIVKAISKTMDITGGLPRVAELFEARKPKDPAVVSEVDGVVKFVHEKKGSVGKLGHKIIVYGDQGVNAEYVIPRGRHLLVQDGERVSAGQRLCDGPVVPHDILRIKGVYAVQEYLLNEIQEVYRLQGVNINDKHIEVIVRQMLRKVRVTHSGDTRFLENEQVDRDIIEEENERVINMGGEPATFEPLLLGITRASLATESFISAASFRETTRVLTEASIAGKVDKLTGLKENVILGRLVPAGTGYPKYKNIRPVVTEEAEEKFLVQGEKKEEFEAKIEGGM